MSGSPSVSIVIPAYDSHGTLGGCLQAIGGQSFRSFEVIVVDSGPSIEGERLVHGQFPWVRLERVSERLLPHAARNRGVELSEAAVIVFTDPDVYPHQDWLARLMQSYQQTQGIVVGSVACHGHRWLDVGIHLSKFDMWLPGSPPGDTLIAPTLNLLCPRPIFDDLGGFRGEFVIGDTVFSWMATSHGYAMTFAPAAVVDHHHVSSWRKLLRERFTRGAEFGLVRVDQAGWGRGRILLHLALSILPIRWAGLVARTFRCAGSAGMLGQALWTSPIIFTAHAAWLAGECRSFVSCLARVA
jgi:glycosyltransferase AglE